ncbi:MAG: hypothetical protein WCH34_14140 [Bacteroidota bacterium]
MFTSPLNPKTINDIDKFITDFKAQWNSTQKGKEIQFMSGLQVAEDNIYVLVTDLGLKNNISPISNLLKAFSKHFEALPMSKVMIK